MAAGLWLTSILCWWVMGLAFSALWLLVNDAQRHWILLCYAWEVPVIGWGGAVLAPWLYFRRLQRRLREGHPGTGRALARFPLHVAAIVLGTSSLGYLLGAVQVDWFAALPRFEFAKIVLQGVVTGGLFAVAAYFLAERAVEDAGSGRPGPESVDARGKASLRGRIFSLTIAIVVAGMLPILLHGLSHAQRMREELRGHRLLGAIGRSGTLAELRSSLQGFGAHSYAFAVRDGDERIVEGVGAGEPLLAAGRRDFTSAEGRSSGWFASRDEEHKVVAFERRRGVVYFAVSPITDYGGELVTAARTALVVALCALGVGLALAAMLARSIVRPIGRIQAAASRMARGDLDVPPVALNRTDELAALSRAFDRMAERVRADEADLRAAYRRLQRAQDRLVQQERISAIGRVVSGVAHELNNPLAAVLHLAEDLRSDRSRSPAEREALETIADQVRRCRAIVRNLLSFAGGRERRPERASLESLLTTVRYTVDPVLRQTGAVLEVVAGGDGSALPVDRIGLEQVLANLVANGAQAAGQGGRVRLEASGSGEGWRFVVEDSGPGIPADILPRIFEPFFSTRPEGQGSGLGLAASLGIVEWHGGTLEVDGGGDGRGARFTVRVPPLLADTSATADPSPPPEPVTRRRALVIDDERSIRLALSRYLRRQGWEVDQAEDGEDAMRLLSETGPSGYALVISDLRMPRLSGMEVHDWLATHRPDLFPRLVVMTGDVASPPVREFLVRTPRPVIEKPFELSALAKLVESVAGENAVNTA